jgi:hypothetical protein
MLTIAELHDYPTSDLIDELFRRPGGRAIVLRVLAEEHDEGEAAEHAGVPYDPDDGPVELSDVVLPDVSGLRKADGSPNRSAAFWTILWANSDRHVGGDVYGLTGAEVAAASLARGLPKPPRPQVTYGTLQALERANRVRRSTWAGRTYWRAVGKPNLAAGEPALANTISAKAVSPSGAD